MSALLSTGKLPNSQDWILHIGVDKDTFIQTTGIDDFVPPSPDTNYESLWIAGIRTDFIATGEDTNERYTLAQFYVPPQAAVPPHIHRREDEWFYVLDGKVSLQVENQTINGTSGTLVFGPRDHVHSFGNFGTEPATMLAVWTPSGIEELFREIGDPVTPTDPFTPPEISNVPKLLAAAPRYGIEFVAPGNNNPTPVPEASSALGVLAFGAFCAISILKRKPNSLVGSQQLALKLHKTVQTDH
jgi:quercetin dioxygenase-like cupin family protein